MNEDAFQPSNRPHRAFVWVMALLLVVVLAAVLRASEVRAWFQSALQSIASLGFVGWLMFIALYIVACLLALPGSLLTIGAGTVFGLAKGILLSSVAATLGATAAFLMGRHLARGWLLRRFAGSSRFAAIDRAVGREGWKIVGLTRLSPMFPFAFLNYAYGMTSVSLRDYFFATWIGMLPATVLYVYIGSVIRDVAAREAGPSRVRTPLEWGLYAVGLLATVAVSVYVTRLARRALAQRVG